MTTTTESPPPSEAERDRLRELLAKATSGWHSASGYVWGSAPETTRSFTVSDCWLSPRPREDAELIAAMHAALPGLLAALTAAEAELRMLRGDVPIPLDRADVAPLLKLLTLDRDDAVRAFDETNAAAMSAGHERAAMRIAIATAGEEIARLREALKELGSGLCNKNFCTPMNPCASCAANRALGGAP